MVTDKNVSQATQDGGAKLRLTVSAKNGKIKECLHL